MNVDEAKAESVCKNPSKQRSIFSAYPMGKGETMCVWNWNLKQMIDFHGNQDCRGIKKRKKWCNTKMKNNGNKVFSSKIKFNQHLIQEQSFQTRYNKQDWSALTKRAPQRNQAIRSLPATAASWIFDAQGNERARSSTSGAANVIVRKMADETRSRRADVRNLSEIFEFELL